MEISNKKYATQSGVKIHTLLKNIIIDFDKQYLGDKETIKKIQQHPELQRFFITSAQTEVPIAGYLNGIFHSRRIDRLLVNHETKTIDFIDYKTDIDRQIFFDKYKQQLYEYAQLLCSAYPGYKITGFILWLHDWQLEKIISL
jgi:hypothetical protein